MKTIKLKLSTKIAIFTFLFSVFGITTLATISYYQSQNIFKTNLVNSLNFETKKTSATIEKKIIEIKKDILFLSSSEPILGIKRTTLNKYNFDEKQNMHLNSWKIRLERLFAVLMKQNSSYYQIRLIGIKNNGKELVRVEKQNKGQIKIVKKTDLQNKSKSSYFKNTLKLKEEEIYVSKINLNKEHGVIVVPHIPTVRITTPILIKGELYAMIVININVAELFEFSNFDLNYKNIQTYITNDKGYYIYNKDRNKNFSFEFNKKYLIQDDFKIENLEYNLNYFDEKTLSAVSLRTIFLNENEHIHIMQIANSEFFEKESENYRNILLFYIVIISFIIAILSAILIKYLTSNISKLTIMAKDITNGKDVDFKKIKIKSGDEIEELAMSFKYMLSSLSKSKNELQESANSLEIRVKEEIEKNRDKEAQLAEQAKLVSMGEMIGNIAHQWRQPLSIISTSATGLILQQEYQTLSEENLIKGCNNINDSAQYLSKTIDDFKNFIKGDRTKKEFKLNDTLNSFLNLVEASVKTHNIKIILETTNDIHINGYENELIQCLINITNNAKDILVEKNIEHSLIFINTTIVNNNAVIKIKDNAGGVPKNILPKIFEPYFTTKHQSQGTGLGLHMAYNLIVDGMKGRLEVHNQTYIYEKSTYSGAEFVIKIPLD